MDRVLSRFRGFGLLVGVVALAALAASSFAGGGKAAAGGYLFGFLVWASIAIGFLGLSMLQHLVRARWGLAVLRIFEAGGHAATFAILAVAFVPIAVGAGGLFPWAASPHRDPGAWYLNLPFFLGRAVFYFVFLIGLAFVLRRSSLRRDPEGNQAVLRTNLSGPGMVLLFFVGSFASFDWLMSLDRDWSSTIFGLLFMIVSGMAAMAATTLFLCLNARREPYARIVDPGLLRDLANLLLTVLMLWAYFTFSQYIIDWSGNIRDEAAYFDRRTGGGWNALSAFLIVGGFFVPFLALQAPRWKSRAASLAAIAAWMWAIQVLDLYWMAAPALHPGGGPAPTWQDFAALVGFGGIFVAVFGWQLARAPLLPDHDPIVRRVFDHAA